MELMHVGWGGAMLVGLIVLASGAASVWLLRPRATSDRPGEARSVWAVTILLAVIGVLALGLLAAMVLMHYGMMR